MNNIKVMFINPNPRNMSLVQPVVSLFYAIFKQHNIDMRFFDTTFYDVSETYTDANKYIQEVSLGAKRSDESQLKKYLKRPKTRAQLFSDFRREMEDFQPHVLFVSCTESTIFFTREILKSVRDLGVRHVLGGVFATYASELAISYDEIDMICVGEGENTIVPLVKRLANGEKTTDLPGIWTKEKGQVVKNPVALPVSLDELPGFDASIYEDSRFYRAMSGNIYRMFPVETHRGCPLSCTFCNSPLQNSMYKSETGQSYFRKKSISKVMEDIRYFADEMKAEYIFFWADNFFAYSRKEIDEFCEAYADIKLPFFCQTYPTTLDEYKFKRLVDAGLHKINMGIEHGNEEFRKRVVNRVYSNKKAIEQTKILQSYDVQCGLANIVGFPGETPELHMDTVKLNRIIQPHTASCSIFTPFHGTPLRKLAVELGYMEDDYIAPANSEGSILNMPDFTKEQIYGKARTFNLYVKLPLSRYKDIEKAEENTPEGDRIWEELKQEYFEQFGDVKDDGH